VSTSDRIASPRAVARRGYDSSQRRALAGQNRAAVVAAAAELFTKRGWAATSVRDIARTARVSVETVYATVGSKSELLLRAIDVAIVGDTEPVPLAERPEFLALGQGARDERLDALGRLVTTTNGRLAALNRTFAHAALGDDDLAARWRESQATQRQAYVDGLRLLLGRKPRAQVVDGIWALGSAEVYLHLVELAGWTPRQYRTWLVERIDQLLQTTQEKP
jgi:AcrR family transcriptional regulator